MFLSKLELRFQADIIKKLAPTLTDMATDKRNQDESPEKDEQDDKMHPSDEGTEVMYFIIVMSLFIYIES